MRHSRVDRQISKMTQCRRVFFYYVSYHQNDAIYNYSNDVSINKRQSRIRRKKNIEFVNIDDSNDKQIYNSRQSKNDAMNIRSTCI